MNVPVVTRPLTEREHNLAQWMLEHGSPEAAAFQAQLECAEATTWRCPCGCASFNFKIEGKPDAPPGVHILGDFVVGKGDEMFGIFIFESGGILSGLEVYRLAAEASPVLPAPEQLCPWSEPNIGSAIEVCGNGRNDG